MLRKLKKWFRKKIAIMLAPFIIECVYRVLDRHNIGIKIGNKEITSWALEKDD